MHDTPAPSPGRDTGSFTLRFLSAFKQSWPFIDLTPERDMCAALGDAATGLVLPVSTENDIKYWFGACPISNREILIFGGKKDGNSSAGSYLFDT